MSNAGQIILPYGDAPTTPASGKVTFYSKADKNLYYKDDDGVETSVSGITGDTGPQGIQGEQGEIGPEGTINSGTGETGRYLLGNGITTGTITFVDNFGDTSYTVNTTMMNTTDATVSLYPIGITDVTVSGFSFELGGATDSSNYELSWTAMSEVGTVVGVYDNDYGSILTISGTYSGETMTLTVDDASSVVGSVLAQAADFNYDRADADSTTTSPGFCVALAAGAGDKLVLLKGQICDTSWNWTFGKVYLSETTGGITQTKPSGSGDQVQVLGWALSADTIFFDPVTMVVEVL